MALLVTQYAGKMGVNRTYLRLYGKCLGLLSRVILSLSTASSTKLRLR